MDTEQINQHCRKQRIPDVSKRVTLYVNLPNHETGVISPALSAGKSPRYPPLFEITCEVNDIFLVSSMSCFWFLHPFPYIVNLVLNNLHQLFFRECRIYCAFPTMRCSITSSRLIVSSRLAGVTCFSCRSFSSVTIERSPSKIKLFSMFYSFKCFFFFFFFLSN